MSLIVCKFGGTSVASPERIQMVAKKLICEEAGRPPGGRRRVRHGQDHRRARGPCGRAQRQPARARDGPSAVHGRAGVHDASGHGHRSARLQGHELHGPPGRHRDGRHARQGQDREGAQRAHHGGSEQRRYRGSGRLPGHRRQRRHHHARSRRLRHHGGGGGARPGRRRVRDLLRRGRRLHGRPARVPARQEARRRSPTTTCWSFPAPAPACCRCAPSSSRASTTWSSIPARRSPTPRAPISRRKPT